MMTTMKSYFSEALEEPPEVHTRCTHGLRAKLFFIMGSFVKAFRTFASSAVPSSSLRWLRMPDYSELMP
jgi:hypothetical protein